MKISYFYFLLAGLIATITACKKTINPDPLPQNKILEYKIVNVQDTVIYGTVDNIENTITVYIPYYYGLSVIEPKITLDAHASLAATPQPVSVNATDQTYTVTGGDGTKRTYKLSIVSQNTPGLSLNWFDTNPRAIPTGAITLITGNFLSKSTATLKVTLVNSANNKTVLPDMTTAQIYTNADNFGDTYLMDIKMPLDIDSGSYSVQVDFLGHSVKMNTPLKVYYNIPQVATTFSTQTVAAGDSITFINNNDVFIDLKTVKVTVNGHTYDWAIQTSTRTKIVVKAPDNFPIGNWGSTPFSFRFGNWQPVISNVPLVVKAKTG